MICCYGWKKETNQLLVTNQKWEFNMMWYNNVDDWNILGIIIIVEPKEPVYTQGFRRSSSDHYEFFGLWKHWAVEDWTRDTFLIFTCTMISLFFAVLKSANSSPKQSETVGSGAGYWLSWYICSAEGHTASVNTHVRAYIHKHIVNVSEMIIFSHPAKTCYCRRSWLQHLSPICWRRCCTGSPGRSRTLGSDTGVWWRCPRGWLAAERRAPGARTACEWRSADARSRWAPQTGSVRSAGCLSHTAARWRWGAGRARSDSRQCEWSLCGPSAFLRNRNRSSSEQKLETHREREDYK